MTTVINNQRAEQTLTGRVIRYNEMPVFGYAKLIR